jgi:hypothetical protein
MDAVEALPGMVLPDLFAGRAFIVEERSKHHENWRLWKEK